MLRIITSMSAAGAKSYYSTADYYTEGQTLEGTWHGKAARMLGLSGTVDQRAWDALCDNLHPQTGTKLTPRIKEPRRVGYDFNFHAPKGLSVLYGLTRDGRLLSAFRDSVHATMEEMELEMRARVRQDGKNEDRSTGNLAWGEFVHFTARPVGGVPDPHLHAHCFAFNLTHDFEEGRFKAGQFAGLKRDAPYFEAVFHSLLARRIEELGIATERTKHGWDIAGIPATVGEKFSRRTALIEEKAQAMGITDPKVKDGLGATTRDHKVESLTMPELEDLWRARLLPEECDVLGHAITQIGSSQRHEKPFAACQGVERAVDHCFERTAVVPERRLIAQALRNTYGFGARDRVEQLVKEQNLIRRERGDRQFVTSEHVLAEEKQLLHFAREGRGTCAPLGSEVYTPGDDRLSAAQRKAVSHVLTSQDRVILIRGAAGTGKTTMMTEAVRGIEAGGRRVVPVAPSASASRGVLRSEGFTTADTVARLLIDERFQETARDQVVWVDEAGLLGSRTTKRLFDLAERLNTRVVLSGDRRQHGSVERGGVLRLLETEAGLRPAELKEIRRQKGEYRAAIEALSEGNMSLGFRRLDALGWIKEIGNRTRHDVLAQAYADSIQQPGDTLVVCPTHGEADKTTSAIRACLRKDGGIGSSDHEHTVLRPLNMTEAERADKVNYVQGDVIQLHQNARGFKRGQQLVFGRDAIPFTQSDRFTVYRPSVIRVSPGDRIRITKNTILGAQRWNNGDLHTIRSIAGDGRITLRNGDVLPSGFGHFDYGYVVTSHASQGKSVARAIIAQGSESFPASSREQFYVSASRAKQSVMLFTDDKAALLEAVSQGDDRLTATDLVAHRELAREHPHATPHRPSGQRRRPSRRPGPSNSSTVARQEAIHER